MAGVMNFEHFGPSRDLLYGAFLLLGAAAGAALLAYRRHSSLKSRARWISALLCLASAALAALAGSVILSGGLVFTVASHYPFAFFFLLLGAAALCFPLAGGCTSIFAAGLFTVWICFSFLTFPRFETPLTLSLRSSGGELLIRRGAVRDTGGNHRGAETWTVSGETGLVFEAAALTAHRSYPVIGGERRGLITRVLRDGEPLFAMTKNLYRFTFSGGLGFSLDNHRLELPAGTLPPGTSVSVVFNGERLSFDPPLQL